MNIRYNRWLILSASILINVATGAGYAWSVFIGPLSKNFGWSPTNLAIAYTINMGILPIPMIFGDRVLKLFGEKKNIIVGGLVHGPLWFLPQE